MKRKPDPIMASLAAIQRAGCFRCGSNLRTDRRLGERFCTNPACEKYRPVELARRETA